MSGYATGLKLTALDAIEIGDCDTLIAQLLEAIEISVLSVNRQLLNKLRDLKQVLVTEYCEAPGMPANPLIEELSLILELQIRGRLHDFSGNWNEADLLRHMKEVFGPREIVVRAEPYRRGSGLALRGFFCRAEVRQKSKFLIFLNTAHPPAVVAATLGHELGHYIYGYLVQETANFNPFIEGSFSHHLCDGSELFADCLVALAAYDHETLERIASISNGSHKDRGIAVFKEINRLLDSRYHLNLRARDLAVVSRVGYLTGMIHFFKLRRALFQRTGI
jgi:hypothetical protein